MEIKDYLHLYLGCEVVFDNEKYLGNPEKLTIEVLHNIDYGNLYNNVKPILRNLSELSKEEKEQLYNSYDYGKDNIFIREAKRTTWLISHYFDLFNLHEQGLCLYKSDLK